MTQGRGESGSRVFFVCACLDGVMQSSEEGWLFKHAATLLRATRTSLFVSWCGHPSVWLPLAPKSCSEVKVVYKEARDVAGPEVASTPAMGNGADAGPNSKKRASTGRGKDGKRRIPAPKWLVFTSWWNVSWKRTVAV